MTQKRGNRPTMLRHEADNWDLGKGKYRFAVRLRGDHDGISERLAGVT